MRPRDPLRAGFGARRPPEDAAITLIFGQRSEKVREDLSNYLYMEMLRDTIGFHLRSLSMIEAGRMHPKAMRGHVPKAVGYRIGSRHIDYRQSFMADPPPWVSWILPPFALKCMDLAIALNRPLPHSVIDLFDLKKELG